MPLARQPVDSQAEQRVHRRVRDGRAVEAGGLDPDAVHDVQTRSRMPGVAGVQRGVPHRPVHVLRSQGAGERGWAAGAQGRERGERERAELVRRLVVVDPGAVQVAAELDPVLRIARHPGELVGELEGPVVGALRRGAVTAEGEGRDVLAAVPQRRCDVDPGGGEREQRAHVLAMGRHVPASFVDEVPAEIRGERRHHTAGPFRAPGPRGRESERADMGGLLRNPASVEAQREGVHGRQLPVEAQQAERVAAGAVVGAGQHDRRAGRPRQGAEAGSGIGTHAQSIEGRGVGRGERGQ